MNWRYIRICDCNYFAIIIWTSLILLRYGDENIEIDYPLFLLGDPRVCVDGLSVIFVLAIVKKLKEDRVFDKISR